jgi:DNA-binding HxlR family transcriptional regulator
MPEASERVLAQQRKELVEYGVVEKKVIAPVCRHSEYSLTDLGRTLIPIIEQLRNWGNDFRPRMEQILKEKE